MTEKDFRRLRRQDFLQLLLAQGKENASLQAQLTETQQTLAEAQTTNDRLKEKLNDKDDQIDRLKEKLDDKDLQLNRLKERLDIKDRQIETLRGEAQKRETLLESEFQTADAVSRSTQQLTETFRAAQAAVDRFTDDLHRSQETRAAGASPQAVKEAEEAADRAIQRMAGVYEIALQAMDTYAEDLRSFDQMRPEAEEKLASLRGEEPHEKETKTAKAPLHAVRRRRATIVRTLASREKDEQGPD